MRALRASESAFAADQRRSQSTALTSFSTGRTIHQLRSLLSVLRRAGALVISSRPLRQLAGHGRRLQVQETVQLGEKRFVAILRVGSEQFLIGGGATGVSLLCNLPPEQAAEVSVAGRVAAFAEQSDLTFEEALEQQALQRGIA